MAIWRQMGLSEWQMQEVMEHRKQVCHVLFSLPDNSWQKTIVSQRLQKYLIIIINMLLVRLTFNLFVTL